MSRWKYQIVKLGIKALRFPESTLEWVKKIEWFLLKRHFYVRKGESKKESCILRLFIDRWLNTFDIQLDQHKMYVHCVKIMLWGRFACTKKKSFSLMYCRWINLLHILLSEISFDKLQIKIFHWKQFFFSLTTSRNPIPKQRKIKFEFLINSQNRWEEQFT